MNDNLNQNLDIMWTSFYKNNYCNLATGDNVSLMLYFIAINSWENFNVSFFDVMPLLPASSNNIQVKVVNQVQLWSG